MNATERARRSDSLYYDTQVTNRRALCDMIAHLESDLAESKAENAKLRELVSGLEYCARVSVCDCCCPLYDSSGTDHRRCESLERELGVEVGE